MSSAATVDLSTADGRSIPISGSSTVTGLGTEVAGIEYILTTLGTQTWKHSSALSLPGAADITTGSGDYMLAQSKGSGNWVIPWFTKASVGSTPPFTDSVALVKSATSATNTLRLSASALTAARVVTFPDADLSIPAVTTKGDMIAASASGVLSRVAAGSAGTIPMTRAASTPGVAFVAALNKAIYGLTYANGTDATNDIDIAAGGCMDSTGAYWITLSAITKQLDASWAVGTNAGGLDTGSIGNSDYYIWAIARSDTGVTDVLFSLSSTAPTMPANYDFKRLIGWFKRVGATIVSFKTYELSGGGLELLWSSPTLDIDLAATLTTSRRTDAVKVPLNLSTVALLNVSINDGSAGSLVYLYCPDLTDVAPSSTVAPLATSSNGSNNVPWAIQRIRTSSAGLIAARASVATIDNYRVSTLGFEWARRD